MFFYIIDSYSKKVVNFSPKDQIICIWFNFKHFKMITALWRQHVEQFPLCPVSIFWDLWLFFLLIFQNQSVAGDVIQQIKKRKPKKTCLLIWHKCQWASVIMNCPSYVVVVICGQNQLPKSDKVAKLGLLSNLI